MSVPFLDLRRQYSELEDELSAAIRRVLESGLYVLRLEVEAFEKEWAHFCGAAEAASVASGTDALSLALIASGAIRRGRGDEVITSPLTAPYTALAIIQAGGVPIFADIDPRTYTLDPFEVEKALTPRTRAVMPVHLYGRRADVEAINEIAASRNLVVVEDAAQAHGLGFQNAHSDSPSHAVAFSFYPTKNLGAYGDGGAVVSNDPSLIRQVKILRQGGHEPALRVGVEGHNSRLDELQAAVLRVKLMKLEAWNNERMRLAEVYADGLRHDTCITLPSDDGQTPHVQHLYVIRHRKRDRLRGRLLELGIETMIHYPLLLHQQPLFRHAGQRALPMAEGIVNNLLSLPLYPQLRDEEARVVVEAILRFDGLA